jgi:hypothetical protein
LSPDQICLLRSLVELFHFSRWNGIQRFLVMARRQSGKVGLDPLKIFEHATRFHESDHRLRNTVPRDSPKDFSLVGHPAMVLSVFASELYLKCLLCVA